MDSLIKIRNVHKFYQRAGDEPLHALNDVSLEIGDNEFISLLGPSGCGKSTLLRVIDGLIDVDHGDVTIGDKVVDSPGPDRAMVFQQFALLPWATVIDNITFPLEAKGHDSKERQRLAKEVLKLVGLEGFERHYPRTLSGGMQQRVGIARALVVDPQILLMDEPFGALDSLTRTFLQDELLDIWSNNRKTVVFVTHAIDEAIYLSDRVVVMSPRPGKVAEVLEVPLDRNRTADVRDEPEFVEAVGYVRRLLRDLTAHETATP